jgi:hypothetical protein
MTEIYHSGDNSRTMYSADTPEAAAILEDVRGIFPWASLDDAFAISTPVTHEVLGEQVVSTTLVLPVTKSLVGSQYALSNRKFCLGSQTSFLRVYPLWTDEYPDFLPEGCNVLFKGENLAEYRRPAPSGIEDFYDCYLKGDPATMEQHFGLEQIRGDYETFYGVTVKNNVVVRVKQYVYDEQSIFSDWDAVYIRFKRRLEEEG